MKWFILEIKNYGLKIALGNLFLIWIKDFIGAKRIQITYFKKSNRT